jgi:hypothetical protein
MIRMMTSARAAVLLLLALCAAPPAHAQPAPRCAPAPGAEADTTRVRWDCGGSGPTGMVRFSVSLPAGWQVREPEDDNVMLMAENGGAFVVMQGYDQLFVPVTANDTAAFWGEAAELMLGRGPTPREVAELRRDAGDEGGARFMLTRAQSTDSALLHMAGSFLTSNEQIHRLGHLVNVDTLSGQRAGYLFQRYRIRDLEWEYTGRVTVRDGVTYGIVFAAPTDDYIDLEPVWERVLASFVIHPSRP